jgi:signal transduction histidine kinase/ligand-binding sensor domain-containing protein
MRVGRLIAVMLALLAAGAAAAAALPPIRAFKHMSWSLEGGAPSRINAIGQSRDGYLWIGSVDGLFRFDGVTFEKIHPDRRDDANPVVAEILGARSGALWAGLARSGGVMVYRGGHLVDAHMPNPSREVTGLAEGVDGTIWVARGGRTRDILAAYAQGRWRELGPAQGLPDQRIWGLHVSRDGTLWAVLAETIVFKSPAADRFEPTGARVTARASLAEDPKGRIWVSDARSTRLLRPRAKAGVTDKIADGFPHADAVGGSRILFDQAGRLWGTTWTDGIFQIPPDLNGSGVSVDRNQARIAGFTVADGLTSDQTHALFVDRENDVWIGSELGLDMLRPAGLVVEPNIPANSPQGYRIAAAPDGAVYISGSDAIYRVAPHDAARLIVKTSSLPGALCTSANGVWATLDTQILHIARTTIRRFAKPDVNAYGCAEDAAGRLWMPAADKGLYWFAAGGWHRWPGLSSDVGIPANVARAPDGRAAILFRSKPPRFAAAPFEPIFKERFDIGGLEGLSGGVSALYVGGATGLARLRAGSVATLAANRYPWLGSVNGLVQTPAGETWTIGDTGIVRMRSAALDNAFARGGALAHEIFDFRDGLNSFAQKTPGAQAAVGGDGRLWFLTRRNILYVDPATLHRNRLAPPVVIRSISTATARYRHPQDIALPAGTTSLTIGYTALSLSVPSRIQFRYRLEGRDEGWIEAGNRRVAAYDNLGPGDYRFRVLASNNDGLWNRQGASVAFSIPPTLTQSWGFRAACVLGAGLFLWGIYSLRLRQVAYQVRSRVEERAHERERIARELHDTLLQGVQGLIIRFQCVADDLPAGEPIRDLLESALDRADQLLAEGRESVLNLRLSDDRPLEVILCELAELQPFAPEVRIDVGTIGTSRPLRSVVVEEVVRIAGEALFNAARHARPQLVELRLTFGRKAMRFDFIDDGIGFDMRLARVAEQKGHFGLVGMRERAERMGATLSIRSAPGSGTTVSLTIPASVAYARRRKPARKT